MNKIKSILFVVVTLSLVNGCSTMKDFSNTVKDSLFNYEKVKPWQRGELAKEDMKLVDDGMMTYADDHIYFSKEAATGGKGVGGGGCGCN